MNTYEEFFSQVHSLNKELQLRLNDEDNNRCVITDGALNPESYYQLLSQEEKPRIMWLMKEPYDSENGTGGGWDFYEGFFKDKPSYYEGLVKSRSRSTWQPVVYITHSIMNDYLPYDDMDYIRDNPKMAEALNHIAWVNLHKLPAIGMTRSNHDRIVEVYRNSKDLLQKQIEMLRPNVIICGGTFPIIRYGLEGVKLVKFGSVNYFVHEGTMYVDAYHPAQTTIGREDYCNDIIMLCKAFNENPYTINTPL
jgi:hypothetical protein